MKKLIILTAVFCGISLTTVKAQFYGVKVDALHLATGTVNAGFEMSVGKQWSLDIPVYWNPIKTDKLRSQFWYVQPGVRYWRYEHFVGPFWAAHITYGRYNIGNDRWHYKGWLTGIGASYGYTWILSKRWNLTAEGGLGLFFMRDRKRYYEKDIFSPECVTHHRRIVLAPSKLEVSFTHLF